MTTGGEISFAAQSLALLPKGWELAREVLGKVDDRIQYDFRTAHNAYCANIVKKYCRARTFFIREEPRFLEEFYVPASIKSGSRTFERANLESLSKIGRKCTITASGGSGKTIFMRYLLHDAIERAVGYPVFIELRNLNDTDEKIDLEKIIVRFMKDHGFPLSEDFALQSLRDGLLVVLLDGFDEVVFAKRKALEKEIRRLGAVNASQIVVSSRPDMALEGWDGFASAVIAPLELEEACELISKIPFEDDQDIKTRFIANLRGGLFGSHKYFLSNPLLLSIMLLTYGDSAEIPSKFASFYEQAYTALFQKHDALKSGYRRERRTSLDIYDFARLFSAFSAITYNRRAFRFSAIEALTFAKQASKVAGTPSCDAQGFLDDSRQAVCLLVEDGLDLAFVHRSFQEYFVARFINDSEREVQEQYIKHIVQDLKGPASEVDSVLRMLYEMSPTLVEDNYLIPGLERLLGKYSKRKISKAAWRTIYRKIFLGIQLFDAEKISFSIRNWSDFSLLIFVTSNCIEKQKRHKLAAIDFSAYFDDEREIQLKDVSDRDPLWADLEEGAFFSPALLERVRQYLLAARIRANEREEALGQIFALNSG